MALNATQQWWLRPDGSELNGGGYDAAVSGAGTNYSDQAAAQLSLTDLACLNSTTLTSVTGGFTSQMIGNIIRIASGTNFTPGYYMVTAQTNTNTVTLDRNPTTGANASAGVGKLGGAWVSFRSVSIPGGAGTAPLIATPVLPGNTVNVRGSGSDDPASADYTENDYYTLVQGDGTTGHVQFVGYNGRPCITGSTDHLVFYQIVHLKWTNFKWLETTGSGTNPDYGFVTSISVYNANIFINCIFDQAGHDVCLLNGSAVGSLTLIDCILRGTNPASSGSHPAISGSGSAFIRIINCQFLDIRCTAVLSIQDDCYLTLISSVIARCYGYGVYINTTASGTFGVSPLITDTVINSVTSDGVAFIGLKPIIGAIISNCNITNNGGYGISATYATFNDDISKALIDYNNIYNNTSGARLNLSAGAHDLAVDPQYVDAANNDFTPQNVTLKGMASPLTLGTATNYQWIGAIQPIGGVTPTPQYFYNRAKKELLNGTLIPLTSDLRGMLVDSTYTFNADLQTIDDGTGSDPQSHELAGGTRIIVTGRSVGEDDTNDFGYMLADDVVFPGITTGQTLGGMVLYRNVSGDDTQSAPVAFYPLTLTTDGRSVHVTFALAVSGGALKAA